MKEGCFKGLRTGNIVRVQRGEQWKKAEVMIGYGVRQGDTLPTVTLAPTWMHGSQIISRACELKRAEGEIYDGNEISGYGQMDWQERMWRNDD